MRVPGLRPSCASTADSRPRFSARRSRRAAIDAFRAAGWALESLEPRRLLSGGIPTVPSPAAHWAFDETSGTTAIDSSGNGHTATLGADVTRATGNVGTGAISLTGTANGVVTAP